MRNSTKEEKDVYKTISRIATTLDLARNTKYQKRLLEMLNDKNSTLNNAIDKLLEMEI